MNEVVPAALAGERLDRVVALLTGRSRVGGRDPRRRRRRARSAATVVTSGKHRVAEGDEVVDRPPAAEPGPVVGPTRRRRSRSCTRTTDVRRRRQARRPRGAPRRRQRHRHPRARARRPLPRDRRRRRGRPARHRPPPRPGHVGPAASSPAPSRPAGALVAALAGPRGRAGLPGARRTACPRPTPAWSTPRSGVRPAHPTRMAVSPSGARRPAPATRSSSAGPTPACSLAALPAGDRAHPPDPRAPRRHRPPRRRRRHLRRRPRATGGGAPAVPARHPPRLRPPRHRRAPRVRVAAARPTSPTCWRCSREHSRAGRRTRRRTVRRCVGRRGLGRGRVGRRRRRCLLG